MSFEYSFKHLLRKTRGTVLLTLLAFVLSVAVMFSALILDACDVYKARNEDPYSDYYRLVVDRKPVMSELGYTDVEKMSSGSFFNVRKIHEYFLDITDYTAEISYRTTGEVTPYAPEWMQANELVELYGITECTALSEFVRGEITLEEGRYLTADDRRAERKVCLISRTFATINALSVGDTVEIDMPRKETGVFSVVGIYSNNIDQDETTATMSSDLRENRIFVPLDTLYATAGICYNYQIKLRDDSLAPLIEEKINEYAMCEGYPAYLIRVSELYSASNREIHALENIFEIVQTGVIAISALLIVMFLYSFITSRKRECGVLLALGKTRAQVFASFMLGCAVCIGVGVLAAAIFTGLVGGETADALIRSVNSGSSAEALRITTSDALATAENEAKAISKMLDSSFAWRSIARSLWLLVPVFSGGFIASAVSILRINVMNLLSREEASV